MNRPVRVLSTLLAMACWTLAGAAQPPVRAMVRADRTNLRAQPSMHSEILASLMRGDVVEVLGEMVPAGHKESWSRIELPPSVTVWTYSPGVDKSGQVKSSKLNFRVGPGRNYSVLGSLQKGDKVVIIREFDGWAQIAPPDGAVAYVASHLLASPAEFAAGQPPVAAVPPQQRPTESRTVSRPPPPVEAPAIATPVQAPPPIAPVSVSIPPQNPVPSPSERETSPVAAIPPAPRNDPPAPAIQAPATTPEVAQVPPMTSPSISSPDAIAGAAESAPKPHLPVGSPKARTAREHTMRTIYPVLMTDPDPGRPKPGETLPEPRRVVREGIVQKTISIQAPTDYELRNGFYEEGLINYLYLEPQADLKKFLGKRVRVEGEEYLDSRWRTPVVKAQSVELIP